MRKHGAGDYVFFWHDVSGEGWEDYILPDRVDAQRPAQRSYARDTWREVHNKEYAKALVNRKRIQILLACDFLGIPLPSPKQLTNIGKHTWLSFVRSLL